MTSTLLLLRLLPELEVNLEIHLESSIFRFHIFHLAYMIETALFQYPLWRPLWRRPPPPGYHLATLALTRAEAIEIENPR